MTTILMNILMYNFRFWGLVVSHIEAVAVFSARCCFHLQITAVCVRMLKEPDYMM
jgi:hypothetical protein